MGRVKASFAPSMGSGGSRMRNRVVELRMVGGRASVATAGVVLALTGSAAAQNIQHFEPTAGTKGGLLLEEATTPGHLHLLESVTVNYGREPLVFLTADGKNETVVVSSMTTFNALMAVGLGERFLVGLDVPIHHLLGDGAAAGGEEGFSFGDLRILDRVRILDLAGFSLGAAVPILLPTGNKDAFVGDGSVGFEPKVMAGYDFGALDIGANLGGRFHTSSSNESIAATKLGNTMTYAIGAGLDVNNVRFTGEAFGAVPFSDATSKTTANPLEALLGGRWGFSPDVSLNRCLDGADTGDNLTDFTLHAPSPGASNICL